MSRFRSHLRGRVALRLKILGLLPSAGRRLLAGALALHVFTGIAPVAFIVATSTVVGRVPAAVDEAVTAAVVRAAATDVVEQLPHGLETQLGKSYTDGAELSGGQWPKLELASRFRPRRTAESL